MKDYIEERAIQIANYIIENNVGSAVEMQVTENEMIFRACMFLYPDCLANSICIG